MSENMPASESHPADDKITVENYQRLLARYERLMEVIRQLNSTLDLGTLLNRIIDAAAELTDAEEASILLLDPVTGELRFEATTNMSGSAMEAIPVPLEGSLAGWVATHGQPGLVEDARSDERWYGKVDKTMQFITRNLLAVPMKVHNQVIGVVEAINKREDTRWTDDDVSTLTALADQAAIAVQNARLFQQSDFVAEMVHELRTPLAALKASTSLLLRPSMSDELRQEIVRTMHVETERLTRMTTEFLDLARLESGRARLDAQIFDIRQLAEECADLVRQQAQERDIDIRISGDALKAEADREKIKQVLLNLLTNAIKYNREGGTIICEIAQAAPARRRDPEHLLVRVRDSGYGISSEDQQHVFDKFFRIASTADKAVGTGLGLSIARRIIEAHGCMLDLESEPGVGTTFYFTLPLAAGGPRREKRLPGSAELSSSGAG